MSPALRKLLPALGVIGCVISGAAWAADPRENYLQHCAVCHGPDRYGLTGPALLPESLERLRPAEAIKTVREGRAATQMLPFTDKLASAEIEALVRWIYTPVSPAPTWRAADISASRLEHVATASLPAKPLARFDGVDMLNLFLVVETGDHHVTVLDGDKLEPIHRFPSRYALHGGPKFSPDGRYVFFASRDGWVSKFDMWSLQVVAEVRAGINTRNVAVSSDGKVVAVANYLPHTIVLLDADLKLLKVLSVTNKEGKQSSRVSAIYDAAPRRSFVAALKDIPEVWEISYNPKADDIPVGMVHDFQYKEGAFVSGYLNPRRSELSSVLDDFFFSQDYSEVMGASRGLANEATGQVVNLDVRRKIADLELPGMPHLGSGITWERQGRTVMATPNLKDGVVSIIDMKTWKTLKSIATPGPGFFMRSHEETPYAWVDSMMSRDKDTLQIIDKRSLEKVAEVKVAPGKTLAHIEFTRDGKYALASLWERKADGGAIVVFDAATFKEVKRIPMDKPVGKYNLHNKITRSAGTSH